MTDVAKASPLGSAQVAPTSSYRESWDADAGFYLTMSLVALTMILLGFAPSFYLKSVIHAPPPLSLLTVTHGVVFSGWMLLFVAQTWLIAARKPAPHRQLGILGAVLFGGMIALGCSTAITAGRLGHAPPGAPQPLAFMALPLMDLIAAAVLVAAALWNRRRPDWHKRLMLASVLAMTGPATHRIMIPMGLASQAILLVFVVGDLLLVVAMVHDQLRHKRVHPAYWVAAAVAVLLQASVYWAFGSETWMSFARMLTQTA
jgi:hypothetical protein